MDAKSTRYRVTATLSELDHTFPICAARFDAIRRSHRIVPSHHIRHSLLGADKSSCPSPRFPSGLPSKYSKDTSCPLAGNTRIQENTGKRSRYRVGYRVLVYLLIPIFIYLLTYQGKIHGGIDRFHEGEQLAPLNEMLRGGIPFRDIYLQHGLLQNTFLPWLGSQLFEPTLRGVRLIREALVPLGYVALYFLGLQVFRARFFTAFLCFLIASGTTFYVSPRHGLGLLAFACVANYLTHSRKPPGRLAREPVNPIYFVFSGACFSRVFSRVVHSGIVPKLDSIHSVASECFYCSTVYNAGTRGKSVISPL